MQKAHTTHCKRKNVSCINTFDIFVPVFGRVSTLDGEARYTEVVIFGELEMTNWCIYSDFFLYDKQLVKYYRCLETDESLTTQTVKCPTIY